MKKSLGAIAQIILVVWTITEYLLLFGLLSLVGVLNDLPFWYYPLAAVLTLILIYILRRIKKKINKDKIEKFKLKDE